MNVSILLGAGFSEPQGYPIGNSLNQKILNCREELFVFAPCGELYTSKDCIKPNTGKTQYDHYFNFCMDLIDYYDENIKSFDYEEFYDYFNDEELCDDTGLIDLFEKGNYNPLTNQTLKDYLFQIKSIYNQIILYFLVDKDGECWYDNAPHIGNIEGYNGFLECLKAFKNKGIVNIHTLNHDLFFERLKRTDYICGDLSDGFEESLSPYYGKLSNNKVSCKCRLERYTEQYRKNIRLYKLHGSLDYYLYRISDESGSIRPDNYVKIKYGVGGGDLYKKVEQNDGSVKYDRCVINYHSDFLTGTTSKIKRYKEPLLFTKLFNYFESNLKDADILIIIGYGCKDLEVNKIIKDNFDNNKKCFIIDPFAGEKVCGFAQQLGENTQIVKKQIEDISMDDLT